MLQWISRGESNGKKEQRYSSTNSRCPKTGEWKKYRSCPAGDRKKIIGELIPDGKNFQIFVDGNSLGAAKSLDDGIEAVIRNWNLHD